jgi:hypothetical protein
VLKGGTFNVTALWQDTETTDPLTGEKRQFSDFVENHLRAELRQDLKAARFAWGASYEAYSKDTDYRLNEINRFRELKRLDLFVETTWIASMKLRLEMQSALSGPEVRDRRFYSPDRNGALVRHEVGEYLPGHWWLLTLSSNF